MTKKIIARICLIALLTLLGLAVAAGITFLYGDGAEEIYIGSETLAFAPVYNRDGSWFHGRLQIGYRPGILLLEHVIIMLLLIFLCRFMDFVSMILKMSGRFGVCLDLAMAATAARVVNVLSRKYTLDYVYIAPLHGTYDLIDFYIGISVAIMLAWGIVCEVKFLRLKKRATEGMNFMRRMRWELIFTGNACRAAFLPAKRWSEIQKEYGYFMTAEDFL